MSSSRQLTYDIPGFLNNYYERLMFTNSGQIKSANEVLGFCEDALEAQNRFHTEELSQKISQLKSVAYDIEVEAKDHNRLLDDVGTEFDSSQGFLSGSLNRVNKMMFTGRSDRKLMCYVCLITVGLFIVFYYLAHKATR